MSPNAKFSSFKSELWTWFISRIIPWFISKKLRKMNPKVNWTYGPEPLLISLFFFSFLEQCRGMCVLTTLPCSTLALHLRSHQVRTSAQKQDCPQTVPSIEINARDERCCNSNGRSLCPLRLLSSFVVNNVRFTRIKRHYTPRAWLSRWMASVTFSVMPKYGG